MVKIYQSIHCKLKMQIISSRPAPGFRPLIWNTHTEIIFLCLSMPTSSCSSFGQPLATTTHSPIQTHTHTHKKHTP